jgi:signal transduction histidine kinase/ActR/RegA family two-component response regulator
LDVALQPSDSPYQTSRQRIEFLLGVDAILRTSPDIADTFPRLVDYLVPSVAEWCLLDVAEDGRLIGVAAAHADPAKRKLVAELLGPRPVGEMSARVLSTARVAWLPGAATPSVLVPPREARRHAAVSALGLGPVAFIPILGAHRVQGLMTCVRSPGRSPYRALELALLRAITRRAGEALVHTELYRRSLAALQAKDDFLAMLGHELRNPIAAITHAVRVMDRTGTPGEPHARLRAIIDRQARHLSRLVEDLLDVARLTSGKIVLRKEPVDLKDIADRCLALHLGVAGQNHDLQLDAESVVVWGDPTRLEQVLGNVIENSFKYTPVGGRIRVTVRRSGDWGVITIEDTGAGISPDVLPRIFDLFAQGHQASRPSPGGLGIGLTLVRRLVELHGGTVLAESAGADQGTRMEIVLPIGDGEVGGTRAGQPAQAPTRHVLVVEDNADAREALVALLTSDGHRVIAAASGPEAIAQAGRGRLDLALVDIGLPGMDGYEVARRLRALPAPPVRLVALTGYGQATDRQRAREAGFDIHLVKPVDADELNRVLTAIESPASA